VTSVEGDGYLHQFERLSPKQKKETVLKSTEELKFSAGH